MCGSRNTSDVVCREWGMQELGEKGSAEGASCARKSLSLGNWGPLRLDETRERCRYLAAFPQM